MIMSDTKEVEVFDDNNNCLDGLLVDAIALLQSRLDLIPDEFKESALIDLNGNDFGMNLCITYYRNKTEGEIITEKMVARNNKRMELEIAESQYLKLKSEYNPLSTTKER